MKAPDLTENIQVFTRSVVPAIVVNSGPKALGMGFFVRELEWYNFWAAAKLCGML